MEESSVLFQAVEFLKYNKRQLSRIYPKVIYKEEDDDNHFDDDDDEDDDDENFNTELNLFRGARTTFNFWQNKTLLVFTENNVI